MRNIAMITMHSCPAGRLGTRDVGGMNVYVTHVARELAKSGCRVDIYTRSDRAHGQHVAEITPFVRVVHVEAGPIDESKDAMSGHVPAFVEAVDGFRREHRLTYELVHSHYWLSGKAGGELSKRWGVPHVTMFHTTALTKLLARIGEQEPEGRVESEREVMAAANAIVVSTEQERSDISRKRSASCRPVWTWSCFDRRIRQTPDAHSACRTAISCCRWVESSRSRGSISCCKRWRRLMTAPTTWSSSSAEMKTQARNWRGCGICRDRLAWVKTSCSLKLSPKSD